MYLPIGYTMNVFVILLWKFVLSAVGRYDIKLSSTLCLLIVGDVFYWSTYEIS